MSEFQRCLRRNSVLGAVAAFLCYIMYNPMLINLHDGAHTAFSYGLISTSCIACFSTGFSAWTSDNDPSLFKYMIYGMRVAAPITLLCAFFGLLHFSWLGLAGGFVSGLMVSIIGLKVMGPNPVEDGNSKLSDHENQMFHYYAQVLRVPLLTISPLAFGGLLLFEWWGLGAGFIGGALISSFILGLDGPQKPPPPELTPDLRAAPGLVRVASHHAILRSSPEVPRLKQSEPTHSQSVVITSTQPISIPNDKAFPPKPTGMSKSL